MSEITVSNEQREAAMEFCPDELDHQFHTDKYPCVKIAQFLAARDAEVLRLLREAIEALGYCYNAAGNPVELQRVINERWFAVRALLSPAPKDAA